MMDVFTHHIYEYSRGLRNLVLYTGPSSDWVKIERRLQKKGIAYIMCKNGGSSINVFFGNQACINVVKSFRLNSLSDLSDEQDFMLGIMLGYERLKQCDRYLARKRYKGSVGRLVARS
jgi:hypothetical protein